MPGKKQLANPFYVLLLLAGVAFCLTACAYGVMMFRADRAGRSADALAPSNQLMDFMDEHGGRLLAGELGVLALATVAAMGWDRYTSRKFEESR